MMFETEKRAIVGDIRATIQVVSALRRYRAAARALLSARYTDGECDSAALATFAAECDAIESDHQ